MRSTAIALAILGLLGVGSTSSVWAADDPGRWEVAGKDDAPVTVVEYACARCPFCAKITPAMHEAVTSGALAGKAKLVFKPFPLRNHPGAKEAALAFAAAAELGKMWPYVLLTFTRYDSFSVAKLSTWAVDVGLDRVAFERLMADKAIQDRLVASKKEGLAAGVDGTPSFFINGQKYTGKNTVAELSAAIEAAYQQAVTSR